MTNLCSCRSEAVSGCSDRVSGSGQGDSAENRSALSKRMFPQRRLTGYFPLVAPAVHAHADRWRVVRVAMRPTRTPVVSDNCQERVVNRSGSTRSPTLPLGKFSCEWWANNLCLLERRSVCVHSQHLHSATEKPTRFRRSSRPAPEHISSSS